MQHKYFDHLVDEWKDDPLWHHKQGLSYTASGYGRKIPTRHMVRIRRQWYRVYCRIFSNIGTSYVDYNGQRLILFSDMLNTMGLTPRGEHLPRILKAYEDVAVWCDQLHINPYVFTKKAHRQSYEDVQGFLDYILELNLWDMEEITPIELGENFWLSRNGHGAGFFDINQPKLQEAAKIWGSLRVEKTRNGFLYYEN